MIMENYKGTAVHPFPAPVCISKRAHHVGDGVTEPYHAIMCGDKADFIIAAYHDMAPAKMELKRLIDQYKEDPDSVFIFMKDPYKEDE